MRCSTLNNDWRRGMTQKELLTTAVVSLGLAAFGSAPAGSSDDRDHGKRRFKAALSGYNEMLSTLSTPARGKFSARISRDGSEISWRLEYRDVPTSVTQAHIHFGDHHSNGGISVFLCTNLGNSAQPAAACPNGAGPQVVTGTATATDVIGPAGQGIAAGEWEELLQAIRAHRTYANVHTTQFAGGEIRGQLRADD
jgi:hypothetical protein